MTHIGKEHGNSFARWPGRFAVTALLSMGGRHLPNEAGRS